MTSMNAAPMLTCFIGFSCSIVVTTGLLPSGDRSRFPRLMSSFRAVLALCAIYETGRHRHLERAIWPRSPHLSREYWRLHGVYQTTIVRFVRNDPQLAADIREMRAELAKRCRRADAAIYAKSVALLDCAKFGTDQIGRASCRERGVISVGDVSGKRTTAR